jgi:effector-binding domain-containing protein
MEIKTHPAMTVLYSTHQTTINELGKLVGSVLKELYKEAIKNDVLVSGPCYWIYQGMDGHPDTLFNLDIAIPIQGTIENSHFATKELPAFKAVSHMHEKDWTKLSDSYGQIMQFIGKNKVDLTGECREIYWNIDFVYPENNLTEIQVGISIPGLQNSFSPSKHESIKV